MQGLKQEAFQGREQSVEQMEGRENTKWRQMFKQPLQVNRSKVKRKMEAGAVNLSIIALWPD